MQSMENLKFCLGFSLNECRLTFKRSKYFLIKFVLNPKLKKRYLTVNLVVNTTSVKTSL